MRVVEGVVMKAQTKWNATPASNDACPPPRTTFRTRGHKATLLIRFGWVKRQEDQAGTYFAHREAPVQTKEHARRATTRANNQIVDLYT